jgi:serine/threonine protein kinase
MLTPYNEELFVGSRFADRYQILSVVGRGSMGVVYKARHELMGRLVAIKMLRGQLQVDEKSIKRFEREARAASRLDHPNVITVHDFGLTEHRQPYLVMDYVSGVTLYEIQRREKVMAAERAVHIFMQVCDALHHAHFHGVIHRDLKPSNIMVMQKDEDPNFVKVFDLGIAKIAWGEEEGITEGEALTGTGEVCGSPVYLSPEQCKHDPIDHRTDIYSLGVVMYELLTGVPPLMGETVYDTIYLHVHEEAPRFAEVTDIPLPSRLEKIILKTLAKNPDERHQSMQELKWDLQAALVQSDEILNVLPPDKLRRRPAAAPPAPARAADKKDFVMPPSPVPPMPTAPARKGLPTPSMEYPAASPSDSLKDSIRALQVSMAQVAAAVPKEEFKKISPFAMTAVLSCVLSVVATLAILGLTNFGQKPTTKLASPEMEAKSLMFRAPVTADGTLNTNTSPVHGDVYQVSSAPRAVKSETPVKVAATLPSTKKETHPGFPSPREVKQPKLEAPKQKAVVAAAPVAEKPQPQANGLNSFFSMFQQGEKATQKPSKAQAMRPAMAPEAKPGSLQAMRPVMAPEEQPQQPQYQPPQQPQQAQTGWPQPWGQQQPQQASAQQAWRPAHNPRLPLPTQQQPQQAPQMVAEQHSAQQAPPGIPTEQVGYEAQAEAIRLNNEAVQVMIANPSSAIEKLNRALKLNPSYAKARLHLGMSYHNLANHQRQSGDMITAINSYRHSLNILTSAVGQGHPATQSTKADYESCLQAVQPSQ